MDYVVGNVAALISGNITPSRPKPTKRALTPVKHMPSPNVTPKSELVDDRSVFLSPSVQKKKAIVKKSPKRIFQNPDLDVTNENEGNTSTSSPKADKVKKHLKGDLEAVVSPKNYSKVGKSPESKQSKSVESYSPLKKVTNGDLHSSATDNINYNELTPKKKKKQRNSVTEITETDTENIESSNPVEGTPKKRKNKNKVVNSEIVQNDIEVASKNVNVAVNAKSSKNKKKNRDSSESKESELNNTPADSLITKQNETEASNPKKKNKKRKKPTTNITAEENDVENKPTKNKKVKVNPNAVTDKDTDSEHESDDEIESETEENNKEVLGASAEAEEQSSDDEETQIPKKKKKAETEDTEKVKEVNTEEEIKRTLFVGNVPFSKKCKKEIKKIFSKYGQIESVRIRTVPVKDPSVTPKLAVIKQELHPERSTVNVYVKFVDPQCVDDALAENNTVLNNNHLRVTRSGSTGAEHDPRHAVFVGNIPFAMEDEALRERFQGCGEIHSVRVVRDKKTNAGKGFGYVNFTSRDGVELALALTDEDLTVKNRIMRVKRCTQAARPGFQGKNKISQGDRQRNNQGPGKPFNRGNFNQAGRFQGNRRGHNTPGHRGGNNFQGNRGGNNFQGNRGGNNFRGGRGGNNFRGNRGRNNFQGNRGGHNFQGDRDGNNFGRQNNDGEKQDGAYRRLMHKRKNEEGGEGTPGKEAHDGAPREKKARKEFVGMTAEKKKKHKFDKGQKKKKALSEILTK